MLPAQRTPPSRRRSRRACARRGLSVLPVAASTLVGATLTGAAWAQHTAVDMPTQDLAVEILDRRGTEVPRDLGFVDESGRSVVLGDYFDGRRPVILNLGYYGCPSLCGDVINAMVDTLQEIGLEIDADYQVVSVSIDPKEKPPLAAAKKASYLAVLDRPGGERGWHFLCGGAEESAALADAVGFQYEWNEFDHRWDHGAGLFVLSPTGVLSQVLQGVLYEPRDLRLALVEASDGVIGTAWDRILLSCYSYDPSTGSYDLMVWTVVRIGGALTVAGIALMLFFLWRRERTRSAQPSLAS